MRDPQYVVSFQNKVCLLWIDKSYCIPLFKL